MVGKGAGVSDVDPPNLPRLTTRLVTLPAPTSLLTSLRSTRPSYILFTRLVRRTEGGLRPTTEERDEWGKEGNGRRETDKHEVDGRSSPPSLSSPSRSLTFVPHVGRSDTSSGTTGRMTGGKEPGWRERETWGKEGT